MSPQFWDITNKCEKTLTEFGFTTNNISQKVFFVEGVKPGASQADQRILVEIDPDGDGPAGWIMSDAVRMSCVWVEFQPNANTVYGFDKGDDIFSLDDDNGAPLDMRRYGPLLDYVSVCRDRSTQIEAIISGVLPKHIKFSEKPRTFTVTSKLGTPQAQVITIVGTATTSKSNPERLEAQDLSGTPINFIEVLTYANLKNYFTLYCIKHGNVDFEDIRHGDLNASDIEKSVNDKLKCAVMEASVTMSDQTTTPLIIPYDENKNGILDIKVGEFQNGNIERDIIAAQCPTVINPDGKKAIPIIYIHKIQLNYSLTTPAISTDKTITIGHLSGRFQKGSTYTLVGPNKTSVPVTILSISRNADNYVIFTIKEQLGKDFPVGESVLIDSINGAGGNCRGVNETPTYIADSVLNIYGKERPIEKIFSHEIAHAMAGFYDLRCRKNLMCHNSPLNEEETPKTKQLRYRDLPSFYSYDDGAVQKQWECINREP